MRRFRERVEYVRAIFARPFAETFFYCQAESQVFGHRHFQTLSSTERERETL